MAQNGVATTPELYRFLKENCPVAMGVSGGKDSAAVAIATNRYLDFMGHKGPRILIHADLGVTEWKASLPMCELLAKQLGLELMVVRRPQGDMMDRWEQRWHDNCERYRQLECVKLILPWSTPAMRFCTSELKVDQICRALKNRFQNSTIISVNGIRREESPERKKAPVFKRQPKLAGTKVNTAGFDWHPIIEWSLDDVLQFLKKSDTPLHEAYTTWGTQRVSCVFCIMSAHADLIAASKCPDNVELYQRMCELELTSTFAFQSGKWLSDVAPYLLGLGSAIRIEASKRKARQREVLEGWLPERLLFKKGWPTCVPDRQDAANIAVMRKHVAETVGLEVNYTTMESVIARYRELFDAKRLAETRAGDAASV